MRPVLFVALLCCGVLVARAYEDSNLEDDDFAEFEQFDAEDDLPGGDQGFQDFNDVEKEAPAQKPKLTSNEEFEAEVEAEDELVVEDEDNEFEHFQDPEEFEGFQDNVPRNTEQPKITISKVPITVRPRWDAYWLEGALCCLLAGYALSYAVGRAKNTAIATNFLKLHKPLLDDNFTLVVRPRWDAYWLEGALCCLLAGYALSYAVGRAKNTAIATNFLKLHKPLLDDNFTLVGETGSDVVCVGEDRGWRREAEHCFTMWCSGRVCCEGMLLTLKLIKRQDLVHVILGSFRKSPDTLQARIELGKDDSDPFVLCIAQKKIATRLAKEMQDLSVFCPERRPGDKHGLPSSLSVMSECGEATAAILDARVTAALAQYHDHIQYIHISDKYAGVKQMEETAATKPPDTERVLIVSLALGPDGGGAEVRPLLLLIFHLLEKVKRTRLSKEALAKCEKRRQKVAEAWLRGAHAARQEQAAQRREEKRKQEKERILAEDDPEKQRRWELKEQKRQQKRKTPKMKQLKVKAL